MPRKSNSRVIARKAGRPMVIKSKEAREWVESFCAQIPDKAKIGYEGPVALRARIHYRSYRSDLSVELLCDAIQKAGILKNDRQIRAYIWVEAFVDKECPRVVFSLYPYDTGVQLAKDRGVYNPANDDQVIEPSQ